MSACALHQIQHHGEAERSYECADENRQSHAPTVHMQAGGVRRETGVVVGRYRVEQRLPQCTSHIAVVHAEQVGQQQHEGKHLGDDGGAQYHGEYAFDLGKLRGAQFVRGEHTLGDLESAGSAKSHHRGEGHDAQAAELDGEQDDDLAERRPVFAGVHHRNAAGGQGRDGGEERDREVGEDDVRCGDRQQQQAGDDDDQCAEIHHGQTARVPEQTVGDADAANALGGFIAFVSAQYIG